MKLLPTIYLIRTGQINFHTYIFQSMYEQKLAQFKTDIITYSISAYHTILENKSFF